MKSCQNECIEFLTFCLIGGHKNICDRLVDICLVLKTELCGIVTVNRRAHSRKGRLRVIRRTPADIEYHVKVSCLHVIAVGLFFLPVYV